METATTHVAKLQSLEIFGPEFSMDNPAQMSKAMAHQLERAKRADKIAEPNIRAALLRIASKAIRANRIRLFSPDVSSR